MKRKFRGDFFLRAVVAGIILTFSVLGAIFIISLLSDYQQGMQNRTEEEAKKELEEAEELEELDAMGMEGSNYPEGIIHDPVYFEGLSQSYQEVYLMDPKIHFYPYREIIDFFIEEDYLQEKNRSDAYAIQEALFRALDKGYVLEDESFVHTIMVLQLNHDLRNGVEIP